MTDSVSPTTPEPTNLDADNSTVDTDTNDTVDAVDSTIDTVDSDFDREAFEREVYKVNHSDDPFADGSFEDSPSNSGASTADEAPAGPGVNNAGAAQSPPPAPSRPARRLQRDPNGMIGGVAAGLGHHLDVDIALVRIAMIFAALTFGVGPLLYLIAWLVIPVAAAPLTPPYGPPLAGPVSGSYVPPTHAAV